ncbi:MAG: hypothetical protein EOP06_01810 [Proteobacteria bacterium]|nr:MAG: hypothetical protein EOP06_01810 [Pseudomonadota bacterium]
MKPKLGTALIEDGLESESFADVLSLRLNVMSFTDTEELSNQACSARSELRLVILNDACSDVEQKIHVVRKINNRIKILIVSCETEFDAIAKLRALGISEILFRPFKSTEVVYRFENLLSINGDDSLLPNSIKGTTIAGLTIKERRLLAVFLLRRSGLIEREFLFEHVWNAVSVNKKTLDVHLFNLRRKLRHFGFDVVLANNFYRIEKIEIFCASSDISASSLRQ